MLKNLLKKAREILLPPPFDCIQVEVSSICNAECPYCVQACYKDQWKGGLMDMGTFQRLMLDFSMASLVFLQGWGEPLLHPKFWQMVQMVKSTGVRVGFTTNGTRLDGKNLSKLLDSGLDIMGVSLAGIAPDTHERLRKGCDLARLGAALKRLKEMKHGRRDKGPSVHIAFMLLRSNRHELAQLPVLAAEWGVSQIVVSHLNLIGSEVMQEESLLTHPELLPEVGATLERTKEQAAEEGIELHYHTAELENPCPLCTENVLRTCFVSYRGDVSPCVTTNLSVKDETAPIHYFKDQAYSRENYIFGNINEHSLQEIWNSPKARKFRGEFEKRLGTKEPGMRYLEAPCQHCYRLLER
jgi:MoaA/NifB/PqqE/SkfB family radical SAM enzyme